MLNEHYVGLSDRRWEICQWLKAAFEHFHTQTNQ